MSTKFSQEEQLVDQFTPIAWRKSSRSGSGGGGANCIEVGACGRRDIAIRDSKHHASGTLSTTTGEWLSLLAVLKGA